MTITNEDKPIDMSEITKVKHIYGKVITESMNRDGDSIRWYPELPGYLALHGIPERGRFILYSKEWPQGKVFKK